MRRPNLCNNSVGVADDAYKPTQQSNKEEGRVSLMRRVLGGGTKKKEGANSGATLSPKQFGVSLSEMPLTNHMVPKALQRMCSFIEIYGMNIDGLFRLSGGSPPMVERLKIQFNNEGDADLENCGDILSVASLLKIWLKDLPHPLLSQQITTELVTLMHKYEGDTWWGPVCFENISTAGVLPTTVLDTVLRLLYNYTNKHPASISYIPGVFCPLLTCAEFRGVATPDTVELTTKLIQDYNYIFNKRDHNRTRIGDTLLQKCGPDSRTIKHTALVITENTNSQKQRKRKDRHEACIRLDRKFVRSNSEERPTVKTSCAENRIENMRRVSSHEDFSKANRQLKVDSSNQAHIRNQVEPLHEHNSYTAPQPESLISVGYTSDLFDENEHERRRDSERFDPQHHSTSRHRHHRKQKHLRVPSATHSKENEFIIDKSKVKLITHPDPQLTQTDKINLFDNESNGSANTTCLSEPDNNFNMEHSQEEIVPPSPISGVYCPTLDLNTLQEESNSEPVASTQHWGNIAPSEERMASPRNSLVISRRVFTAALAGQGIDPETEKSVLDITTQINTIKRKLKKYEESFEREFGYKPSHADKMANSDTRKMCSMVAKLRKQLKIMKEESAKIFSSEKSSASPVLKEDIIHEIEKRLSEKRSAAGRTEELESMNHEQLVDEKTAMQKSLLQLEGTFGRPSSKEDRDMVRPLYDRYRALKRILLRHAPWTVFSAGMVCRTRFDCSILVVVLKPLKMKQSKGVRHTIRAWENGKSKMKDSVSELGTILEHETMDFSTSPPGTVPSSPPRVSSPTSLGGVNTDESAPNGDKPLNRGPKLDNLHALPPHELLELQRRTRDEKKRLRRELREFELDYQAKTGRQIKKEERHPLEPTYIDYKNAKAKLKFIDALVMKIK